MTPRYCEADPFEGGKQAVAEAWRNLTAVGGRPLAVTDNLNFGNPERPEIMGQLVGCIRGIGEACTALDFPVVSGNVSLYNETNGRAILPTPTIGGVGLLDDFTKSATLAFKAEDEAILLIGETTGWLGQSLYLREICGREEGAPPPVDLAAETPQRRFRARADRGGHRHRRARRLRRRPAGGARRDGDGVGHRRRARRRRRLPPHAFWFGEDQARYVVTVRAAIAERTMARAQAAGVPVRQLGVTGGDALTLPGRAPHSGREASRALRRLAAGLYGGRRWR